MDTKKKERTLFRARRAKDKKKTKEKQKSTAKTSQQSNNPEQAAPSSRSAGLLVKFQSFVTGRGEDKTREETAPKVATQSLEKAAEPPAVESSNSESIIPSSPGDQRNSNNGAETNVTSPPLELALASSEPENDTFAPPPIPIEDVESDAYESYAGPAPTEKATGTDTLEPQHESSPIAETEIGAPDFDPIDTSDARILEDEYIPETIENSHTVGEENDEPTNSNDPDPTTAETETNATAIEIQSTEIEVEEASDADTKNDENLTPSSVNEEQNTNVTKNVVPAAEPMEDDKPSELLDQEIKQKEEQISLVIKDDKPSMLIDQEINQKEPIMALDENDDKLTTKLTDQVDSQRDGASHTVDGVIVDDANKPSEEEESVPIATTMDDEPITDSNEESRNLDAKKGDEATTTPVGLNQDEAAPSTPMITQTPKPIVTPSPAATNSNVIDYSSPRTPSFLPPSGSSSFGKGSGIQLKPVGRRSLDRAVSVPAFATRRKKPQASVSPKLGGRGFNRAASVRSPASRLTSQQRSTFTKTSPPRNRGVGPTKSGDLSEVINNPLKTDPRLKEMLERLDDINSYRPFKRWKSSFLNRFEEFLTEKGATPAQAAYTSFRNSMQHFVKFVKQVQLYVDKGDLTIQKTSVKGRNSLNEMNKWLVQVIAEETDLVPARAEDEKRRGYTKFHLGAVLVRDGFREYAQLHDCCEILAQLKANSLHGVADKQQLEEIDKFDRQMVRFRDLMADLGLHEVMLKCWEFSEPVDEFIFVDLKTGAIGAVDVKLCLDQNLVHQLTDDQGEETGYKEAIVDKEDRSAVLDLVREVLKV